MIAVSQLRPTPHPLFRVCSGLGVVPPPYRAAGHVRVSWAQGTNSLQTTAMLQTRTQKVPRRPSARLSCRDSPQPRRVCSFSQLTPEIMFPSPFHSSSLEMSATVSRNLPPAPLSARSCRCVLTGQMSMLGSCSNWKTQHVPNDTQTSQWRYRKTCPTNMPTGPVRSPEPSAGLGELSSSVSCRQPPLLSPRPPEEGQAKCTEVLSLHCPAECGCSRTDGPSGSLASRVLSRPGFCPRWPSLCLVTFIGQYTDGHREDP